MENKKYDVIIVGAGGAGLMLAREMGRKKRKTLLLDRKTDLLNLSFKTLGSFMDIKEFDLSPDVVATEINKVTLYSKNVKHSARTKASILDKAYLHQHLIESLDKEYVDIETGVYIKKHNSDTTGNITEIIDNKGNTYSATYFVDATGLSGVLSKKSGLQEKEPDVAVGVEFNVKYKGNTNEAHLYLGNHYEGGYGWLFPMKDNRAILGFGSFDILVVKELKKRLNKMLTIPHIAAIVEKDNDDAEGGILPITSVKTKIFYNNLICVGDSVSQVNPVVGEGYKFIFRSAVMAANAIEKALSHQDASFLSEYEQQWNKQYYNFYCNSKRMQEKLIKYSKSDTKVNIGMLFLKTKRDKTVEKIISGEFTRRDNYLP
ncbi:FAD-dependent monooxygenase [Flavobacterium soli]|uniref:FAD-dependent monooxygenase n=1 Tax=Flavobacterium soli TaxID=344881 RepID=UPI000422874C|nr:NAD(P)/FAD-dependent oxidoreductase [Flavobacterium soli]